jgi:hypothetical protein
MSAEVAVADYYEALRRGEPLYPYFFESSETYKAAISTSYRGYDEVAEALREQTRATTDWVVDSTDLSVVERDDWAAFNDAVTLAWTSTDDEERHEYETRWSGTLEAHGDEWLFLELHVSTARSL